MEGEFHKEGDRVIPVAPQTFSKTSSCRKLNSGKDSASGSNRSTDMRNDFLFILSCWLLACVAVCDLRSIAPLQRVVRERFLV